MLSVFCGGQKIRHLMEYFLCPGVKRSGTHGSGGWLKRIKIIPDRRVFFCVTVIGRKVTGFFMFFSKNNMM